MLQDEAIDELAVIMIEGFMKNDEIKKHKKHKAVAIEQLKKLLKSDNGNVEISLKRFHAWFHKWNIGSDEKELAKLEMQLEMEEEVDA